MSTFFLMYDNHKTFLVLGFPKFGLSSLTVNVTGDIENFVQVKIVLNKTEIVEIWTKFFISLVILKAQKSKPAFCKCQDCGTKTFFRINAANYFKDYRRPLSRLALVTFRGLKIRDWNVVWLDRQIKSNSFIYYASESSKLFIFLWKHSHGFSHFRDDLNMVLLFDIGFTTHKLSKMSSVFFLLKRYRNWTQFWFNIWN